MTHTDSQTPEDIIVEIAYYEGVLDNLQAQLNEDVSGQNPQLVKDIAEIKRKIAAANMALAAASKLKDGKGDSHKSNIMGQRAKMIQKLEMLKSHADKVDNGGVIGRGEIDKKKDDVVDAKAAKAARKQKNKENAAAARAKSKELAAARKAAKKAPKSGNSDK